MWQKVVVCMVLLAGVVSTVFVIINTTSGKSGGKKESNLQAATLPKPLPFDGKRAMKYLESICEIGPRQSATPGMRDQIKLVVKHFEDLGVKVEKQTFQGKQVTRQNAVEMTNLLFRFWPEREKRIVLCSHYDTRPIADQEPDPRDWRKTFVSANDGGSGVALLMEMANHMKDAKINVGVDFVLFDGEEYIFDKDRDEYFFGSKHFAKAYTENRGKMRYEAAILLDMIAGKNAKFPIEEHSWQKANGLCKDLWEIARQSKCNMFQDRVGDAVYDDHIALQNAGIPAIDLIDFTYAHWHRLTDVPANCSVESMSEVARVLSIWMQTVK
jgi:glutaminyl-peptide cyclotransferase